MAYQLVTRRDIKRASDLKGSRFGISRFGSSSEFGLRTMLKRVGVDAKDVQHLANRQRSGAIGALNSGSSMARCLMRRLAPRPSASTSIFSPMRARLGIPYFNTGICGSAKVLQKNETKIMNFLRAYLEAMKIFKTEPEYT